MDVKDVADIMSRLCNTTTKSTYNFKISDSGEGNCYLIIFLK
jgi:hypothetical protein